MYGKEDLCMLNTITFRSCLYDFIYISVHRKHDFNADGKTGIDTNNDKEELDLIFNILLIKFNFF